ncbi:hypothetical protein TrCOL_g12684 [Triparma columacea]|uniref:Uncharacterized protein n=1 Tax=Triparma columacea TaxID=722753 RepID=A0A9W7LCP6_9STRA|nr:hypothetical protein TrCOL_g12684 [Triparma columacea]
MQHPKASESPKPSSEPSTAAQPTTRSQPLTPVDPPPPFQPVLHQRPNLPPQPPPLPPPSDPTTTSSGSTSLSPPSRIQVEKQEPNAPYVPIFEVKERITRSTLDYSVTFEAPEYWCRIAAVKNEDSPAMVNDILFDIDRIVLKDHGIKSFALLKTFLVDHRKVSESGALPVDVCLLRLGEEGGKRIPDDSLRQYLGKSSEPPPSLPSPSPVTKELSPPHPIPQCISRYSRLPSSSSLLPVSSRLGEFNSVGGGGYSDHDGSTGVSRIYDTSHNYDSDSVPFIPCPVCGHRVYVREGGDGDEAIARHLEREECRENGGRKRRGRGGGGGNDYTTEEEEGVKAGNARLPLGNEVNNKKLDAWISYVPGGDILVGRRLCGQVPINHHYTFTSSTNFYTLTHLYNLLLIRHSFLRQNARVFETPLYLPPNGWPAFKGSDREGGRLIRSLKETNEYVEQIAKICEIKVKRASWMDRKAPSPKQMPVTQKKRSVASTVHQQKVGGKSFVVYLGSVLPFQPTIKDLCTRHGFTLKGEAIWTFTGFPPTGWPMFTARTKSEMLRLNKGKVMSMISLHEYVAEIEVILREPGP